MDYTFLTLNIWLESIPAVTGEWQDNSLAKDTYTSQGQLDQSTWKKHPHRFGEKMLCPHRKAKSWMYTFNLYSVDMLNQIILQTKEMMKRRKAILTHGKEMHVSSTRSLTWWSVQCSSVSGDPRFSPCLTQDGPQFGTQSQGQCSRRYNLSPRFSCSSICSLSLLPFFCYFCIFHLLCRHCPSHFPHVLFP